jgi:hypothetical protein
LHTFFDAVNEVVASPASPLAMAGSSRNGREYSYKNVSLERKRRAAGAKTSGTSEKSSMVIFERFDVCGRMKSVGQERFWTVLILLLVPLAVLSQPFPVEEIWISVGGTVCRNERLPEA